MNDGGLLPSYAKLDSIDVRDIRHNTDSAFLGVYTRWRTSMGYREKTDSMQLVKQGDKWFIIPSSFVPEIPDEQVRTYTYTLFKKQGKRVISSFPTVKDDKVKKPFVTFKQAHLIRDGKRNFIAGEILNADDIPVNIALKAAVHFKNDTVKIYYPGTAFQYNLSPKASTFFQVDLDSTALMDSLKISSIELFAETDVSEKGYIHGGAPGYSVQQLPGEEMLINASMYNEMTTEINIPGLLIAEKDSTGNILQTQLVLHPSALRSGLHNNFQCHFQKIAGKAMMLSNFPLTVFVNGQSRNILPTHTDETAILNHGIVVLPHSFISQEIYLQ